MMLLSNPLFYVVATLAVLFYGLSKGGFNGAGVVSMPLLALVVEPLTAAAIMLPILLAQDAFSINAFKKTISKESLIRLLPAGLMGIVFGALFVSYISANQIKICVGVIAVTFALHKWFGGAKANAVVPHNTPRAVLWGGISGFTSFFIHAGGTPYNIYLLNKGLDKMTYAGTTAIFFATINVAKIPSYLQLGTLNWENFKISLIFIPWAIISNMLGIYLLKRVPQEKFIKIILWLTFLAGSKLLYDGVLPIFQNT